MQQAVQAEWRKLPPAEISCLDQGLRQQGASVDALVDRGVFPSDPRLSPLLAGCRGQAVQVQPATAQPSPYVVDGLPLGGQVRFGSDAYRRYQCAQNEKFPGFTWCHKEEIKHDGRNRITLANSILHTPDGTAWYVNRYIEPTFFAPNDVESEIDRLSATFSERPRLIRMSQRVGLPNAVIAIWGKIQLDVLDAHDLETGASGGTVKGLLVSFLGDLQRSAKAGVPVYRLAGGAGFLWAATVNQDGSGVLRFLTIDASKITPQSIATNNPNRQPPPTPNEPNPQPPSTPNNPNPQSPATPKGEQPNPFAEFTRLLDTPNSCLAIPPNGPSQYPKMGSTAYCVLTRDCLFTLSAQISTLLDYLRGRPLLSSELRKQPILRPFESFDRLFAGLQRAGDASKRISPNTPLDTFGCHDIFSQLVYVYGNKLGAPSGLEFAAFAAMANGFIGQLKSNHDADLARYSDWLPFAKHYERQAKFSNLKDQYEAAYESDPEAFIRIRQQFIQELSAADEYKRRLLT